MRTRQHGFTLIELMVVISIIAFLASLIIAATSVARAKARDVAVTSQVESYQTGLALYLNDNSDTLPDPGNTTSYYCVGKPSSGQCQFWDDTFSGSDVLNQALSGQSATLNPSFDQVITVDGLAYQDAVYKCNTIVNGACTAGAVYWAQDIATTCSVGETVVSGTNQGSVCAQDAGSNTTNNVQSAGGGAQFSFSISSAGGAPVQDVTVGSDDSNNPQYIVLNANVGIHAQSQPIELSASDVPSGASISFSNDPCAPRFFAPAYSCGQTMTVSLGSTPPANGTYPITITGVAPSDQESATFNLIVSN